jgi:hypothetical protein
MKYRMDLASCFGIMLTLSIVGGCALAALYTLLNGGPQ